MKRITVLAIIFSLLIACGNTCFAQTPDCEVAPDAGFFVRERDGNFMCVPENSTASGGTVLFGNSGNPEVTVFGQIQALGTPRNLMWNVDENGEKNNGYVSWDVVEGCEGEYYITLYRDGEEVFGTHWSDLYDQGSHRVSVDFIHTDIFNESGTYVFTVRAIGDGDMYADSEIATSGEYKFEAPSRQLKTPGRLFWLGDGEIKHEVIEGAALYLYTIYNQDNLEIGAMWTRHFEDQSGFVHQDLSWYFKDLAGWNPDLTSVYVTVTGLTGDIEVIKNSGESIPSTRYDIKKQQIKVDSVLERTMDDFYNLGITATEALDSLIADMEQQEISNTDLAISMIQDEEIVASLGELEEKLCEETGISVSVANSSTDAGYLEDKGIDTGKISVIGAALNSDEGRNVNINFSKADDSLSVDSSFYKNSVALEIDIEGVKNSGKLDVPIQMTMPIPTGVLPSRFIILHYHSDGTIERIRPALTRIDGTDCATFVLTSFSPFVFCNESIGTSYDDDSKEVTVSSEVDIDNAVLIIAAYQNDKMVSVETAPLSVAAGSEEKLNFDSFDTTAATELKILIWEKSTMKPIISANKINAF